MSSSSTSPTPATSPACPRPRTPSGAPATRYGAERRSDAEPATDFHSQVDRSTVYCFVLNVAAIPLCVLFLVIAINNSHNFIILPCINVSSTCSATPSLDFVSIFIIEQLFKHRGGLSLSLHRKSGNSIMMLRALAFVLSCDFEDCPLLR